MRTRYMRAGVKLEFVCPKCPSREWGSWLLSDGTLQRMCHGAGCKHTWHELADYRHFRAGGRLLPSKAAYERVVFTSVPPELGAAETSTSVPWSIPNDIPETPESPGARRVFAVGPSRPAPRLRLVKK